MISEKLFMYRLVVYTFLTKKSKTFSLLQLISLFDIVYTEVKLEDTYS